MESEFERGSREGWSQALDEVSSRLDRIVEEGAKNRSAGLAEVLKPTQPGGRLQWTPSDLANVMKLDARRREADEVTVAMRNVLEELKKRR